MIPAVLLTIRHGQEIRNTAPINIISRLGFSHANDRSNFPNSLCLANNKKWKQLLGKVKVWKLTSYGRPPSDFSTSPERWHWYPAGRLWVPPSGPQLWPPSPTRWQKRAAPWWHGCWSGRRLSENPASPLCCWTSFCLSCCGSLTRLSRNDWAWRVGGF